MLISANYTFKYEPVHGRSNDISYNHERNITQTSLNKKSDTGLKCTRIPHMTKPSEGQRCIWVSSLTGHRASMLWGCSNCSFFQCTLASSSHTGSALSTQREMQLPTANKLHIPQLLPSKRTEGELELSFRFQKKKFKNCRE